MASMIFTDLQLEAYQKLKKQRKEQLAAKDTAAISSNSEDPKEQPHLIRPPAGALNGSNEPSEDSLAQLANFSSLQRTEERPSAHHSNGALIVPAAEAKSHAQGSPGHIEGVAPASHPQFPNGQTSEQHLIRPLLGLDNAGATPKPRFPLPPALRPSKACPSYIPSLL